MINVEQPSATFRPAVLLAGSPGPRAGHLPFASDLIAALEPSLIVALGISYGDMYFGFCQLVAEQDLECTCYGIDMWAKAKDAAGGNNTVYDAVSRHNAAKYKAFSHLVRKPFDDALPMFADESISLLELDGLPSYDGVKHAFGAWLPKLKPGGVVLLNDISLRGGEAGSWRLWEELHSKHPHFSFRNNGGLGVLGTSPKEVEKVPFLASLFNAQRDQQERIRRYYFLCAERLELAARLGAAGGSDTGCSLFQVFRSESGNYETAPELSHVLSSGPWVNLHLHLPTGVGDRPLRLDVANRPAVVDIATLSLRKLDGQAAWIWNPKDVTDTLQMEGSASRMPSPEFLRVLSLGSASHVFLPEFRGPAFDQPLDLEIRLRVDLELSPVLEMNRNWVEFDKARADFDRLKSLNGDSAPSSAAMESALAKVKSEAGKQLAQARLDHESRIRQITADTETKLESMRTEFENQAAQLTLQLEEERRAHQATIVDRDQMITQQPRMLQEISIAQGNVEELKAELEHVTAEQANLEYEVVELRKLNARMSAALEEERAVRALMQDSSSWQLTKPFRAVGDLFGPRKRY